MGSEPHEGVHWIMFCGKKIPFKPRQYAAVPSSNPLTHMTHDTRHTDDTRTHTHTRARATHTRDTHRGRQLQFSVGLL
jgi:hypothetical protein